VSILIPVGIRPTLHPRIKEQFFRCLDAVIVESGAECVIDETPFPKRKGENYFANVARSRNHLIDTYLRDDHDEVLWIDAGIISFPSDLYQRLHELAASSIRIVAPLCLIEETYPVMFYDIAGYRERREPMTPHFEPWFSSNGQRAIEVIAVGACVLMPAVVHRKFRFVPQAPDDPYNNTDWFDLMQKARADGCHVYVDTETVTWHAKLPKYGEEWHDGKAWNARNGSLTSLRR
jgi:hypothetical protein